MNEMKPIEIQERWGKAAASGEFDVFDEIIAATVVDHDPAPGQAPGPAVAYTIEGTHQGPFMGVAATGKHVKARGMQIARFEDGKAVERWGSSDELGILKQIGATALPRN